MIATQSLRYLILAILIVTLPTHPMGWLDSTWKKFGVGVAAVTALAGIAYWVKIFMKEHRSQIIELNQPIDLPAESTDTQVTHSVIQAMLNNEIDHNNFRPNAYTFFKIKGHNKGFLLFPLDLLTKGKAQNLLERGTIAEINPADGRPYYRETHIPPGAHYDYPNIKGWFLYLDGCRYKRHVIETPGLIELMRDHIHKKNTTTISKEVFDHPQQIEQFPTGITDIIGAYAAEKSRYVQAILPNEPQPKHRNLKTVDEWA